ncbi:MAG TPA: cation transporter [Bacteroidia bacterium]|nr:cation transporter [Bacteroidia bacterium]
MKKLSIIILISLLGYFRGTAFAQETKTDTIHVYGNCGMCKSTIEGSLKKKDGVLSKNWNKETKILTVTYNPEKITAQKIGEKVAAAGYDNEYVTATDEAYNNLHSCCQYERPKK